MSEIRTPRVDFSRMNCLEQCRALLNAYQSMLSGTHRTQVRHGDYWVEYRANKPADMVNLRNLYMTMRQECADAMRLLPDLSPSARVRRGPGLPLIIRG